VMVRLGCCHCRQNERYGQDEQKSFDWHIGLRNRSVAQASFLWGPARHWIAQTVRGLQRGGWRFPEEGDNISLSGQSRGSHNRRQDGHHAAGGRDV
jgi:hypothetical protein